jgi:PAS domain S-box-containing protein
MIVAPGSHGEVTRRQLDAVLAVADAIPGEVDLPALLGSLLRHAIELVHAASGHVCLWDPMTETLAPAAWQGLGDWVGDVRLRLGEGVTGTVAEHRVGTVVEDYTHSPLAVPIFRERAPVVTVLAEPLVYRDRLLGVLAVADVGPRRFSESDRETLAPFVAHAAIAVESARLHAALERRRRRLETLTRVGRLVTAHLGQPEVLAEIARAAAELTGAPTSGVWVVDEQERVATLGAFVHGLTPPPAPMVTFDFGTSGIGWVALHRRELTVDDVHADERLTPPAWWRDAGITSLLAIPVLHDGRLLGVLGMLGREPFRLDEDDRGVLDSFIVQAATALDNARVFAESERRRRAAEALAEVGRVVSQALDPDAVSRLVLDSVCQLFAARAAAVYLREAETGALVVAAAVAGATGEDFTWSRRLAVHEGLAGVALATGLPAASPDILADPRVSYPAGTRARLVHTSHRALLAVPLMVKDRPLGALVVAHRTGRTFTDEEIGLAEAFGHHAAIALENARLYDDAARRRREAEALAATARAVNASLDLDAVLQAVAESARELTGSDVARIATRTSAGDAMVVRCWAGARRTAGDVAERVAWGRGLGGRVWESGRPYRTAHRAEDTRLTPDDLPTVRTEGIVTALAVPIHTPDGVQGVIEVDNRAAREFTDADEAVLARLADHAATAIRNAELYERERAARRLAQSAHEALVANQRVLEQAQQVGEFGSWVSDLETRTVSWSREVCRIFGLGTTALTARLDEFYERVHPHDRAAVRAAAVSALAKAEPYAIEHRIVRPDGSVRWVYERAEVARSVDGHARTLVGIVQDVTDRHLANAALEASEERYRALVEGSIQGIVVHRDGTVLFANRALAEMLGAASGAEIIGTELLRHVAPSEHSRVVAYLDALAAGQAAPRRYDVQAVRWNGGTTWLEVMPTVVEWDGGPAVLSTVMDVTDRKAAEEALVRSEERLRHAQKMEAVGRLAGGIAHDFNNMLTVIGGRAELLLGALADRPERRAVETIYRVAERAAVLTRRLLAFSRRQMLQPTDLDLNEVLSGLGPMLRRLLGEDIELVLAERPSLERVHADAGQIEQVVVNLAVNARDAMPRGGRLTLETANVTVAGRRADAPEGCADAPEGCAAAPEGCADAPEGCADAPEGAAHGDVPPGPWVVLTVADTGCGMDDETRARIFEPYFTTKEPGRGTGLGLAMVYGFVEQSGGAIRVDSTPGVGSRFRIYLRPAPVGAETVTGRSPEARSSPPRIAAGTVLVVEDEDDVRALACDVLETAGYTVLQARDGVEALGVAGSFTGRIDLLVTDVVMPRMRGDELARELRASGRLGGVVYMSGYVDASTVYPEVFASQGALLQKPFPPGVLLRRVRAALEPATA